jgi:hypothetical protein
MLIRCRQHCGCVVLIVLTALVWTCIALAVDLPYSTQRARHFSLEAISVEFVLIEPRPPMMLCIALVASSPQIQMSLPSTFRC